MVYIKKNGELKDASICGALKTAAIMYENGEIVEVRDILFEILRDINKFIDQEEKANAIHLEAINSLDYEDYR